MQSIQKSTPVRLLPGAESRDKSADVPKTEFKPVLAQRNSSRALVEQSTQDSLHIQSQKTRPQTNSHLKMAAGRGALKLGIAKESSRREVRGARSDERRAGIARNQAQALAKPAEAQVPVRPASSAPSGTPAQRTLAETLWHAEKSGAQPPFAALATIFQAYNDPKNGPEPWRRTSAEQAIARLPTSLQPLAAALFAIQDVAADLGDVNQKGGISPLLLASTPGAKELCDRLALQAMVGQVPTRFIMMVGEARKLASSAKPENCSFALNELPAYSKTRATTFATALGELTAITSARTRPAGMDKKLWARVQADAQKLQPALSKLAAAWNDSHGMIQQMVGFTEQLKDKPLVAAQLIAPKQA